MSASADPFGSLACSDDIEADSVNYCQSISTPGEVAVLCDSTWNRQYPSEITWTKMENAMQTPHAPRYLFGNAANFNRAVQPHYERPLVMDAWAQTCVEDFGLINEEHSERIESLKKENQQLFERVQMLEKELQLHSDLLSQIHATAALKTKHNEILEHVSHTPPATPVMQQHSQPQQHQNLARLSGSGGAPTTAQVTTYTASLNTPQIMNSMRNNAVSCVTHSESVKYTIISNAGEKNENSSVEPIEVHLSEEDDTNNLNGSADSSRLEICLGEPDTSQKEENSPELKTEEANVDDERSSLPPLPAQSGILVKRRCVRYQNDELQTQQEEPKYIINKSDDCPSTEQLTANALRHLQDENVMVSIGPNNTRVPYKLYESINWDNPSIATRKLLMAIFDRQTLATHSMTGKPSPAFKNQSKPQKQRLDPRVTEDIVFVVTRRCKVSDKEVRNAITTKCADENKMMKLQMNKKNMQRKSIDKENQHYAVTNMI